MSSPAARDPGADFPAVLRLESLVAGGSALAHHEGLAVFVPGGAPGDLAEIEQVRRAPDYVMGRISRLIEASPWRREPPCPFFPGCGGCQWQHLGYESQLPAKEAILTESLRRLGRLPAVAPEPMVPSPREFGYRHRVQLKVLTSSGRMRWGFFAATSHTLVDLDRCLIAHPALNQLMEDLESFTRAQGINPSHLGTVELAVDGSGRKIDCVLHPRRRRIELAGHGRKILFRPPGGEEIEVSLVNATLIRRLPIRPGAFTFESSGLTLSSGPGVFSQNNLSLNPRLVRKVVEYAEPGPSDAVADIFCGVGNYALPLARIVSRVEAVENNRRACLYGEENARAAGLSNVRFMQRNALEALADLPRGIRTVIMNPPRVGAADIMAGIASLAPERVVYVSCNPATLARDLSSLSAAGYRLARLAPFDMFPQTHHLETVALMLRSG